MNGDTRINPFWVKYLIFVSIFLVGQNVWCQKAAPSRKPVPRVSPILSNLFLARFNKTVEKFQPEIEKEIGFCTEDVKKDFHGAFDFQGRDRFFQKCQEKMQDLPIRLCTVAELKVYFTSFLRNAGDQSISESHFLEPNRNCNLTSWSSGCEAGWASAANPGQKYDYNETNPKKMPFRTSNSKPCCEGFFCPEGLTCMIPCPLGAHCPVAKLNPATGICLPYHYQLPSGKPNHTCGAADMWVPVHLGNEIFCDPGYYCPTTIKKIECPRGYYCRMGSRVKYRCFAGTQCEKGTEIPSMQVFGVLLIALLTAILIVVYNCSDQVISTRYEKQAKSREAAAQYARDAAQARQKSRASKDNWKPSGLQGLQETLSRTFTRTKTKNATGPQVNKKDTHSIDDNLEDKSSSNLESGDKSINTKHARKASKELHTRSQIFKYAYGQIEREKAMDGMNMDMMYDGEGISLRKRPRIEVAFKELTLTLKGKRKNIMRCVSGKILPGRISAVMGPSGAGKTTFLSALTGKITGCNMSGMILINGKNESIHSYKKIVGFVPQDDIVHGDLTVEENLRFSARCRLSADIPKADKVLITERVIESLGLQGVRDSKVGTVEKRGISGGQKKRVNVGLEMVMEPSLLILDEPTSGLDSASSSLLLRALRREALEGVNISMVVHQPSYSLYKMFDDLILLAKGGLTVYHGPVEKVEEYFGGMGITIPDRVNTPDHLIDILEGITKPGGNVTAQQLPVKWMLHNGYRVPPDMLHLCEENGSSSAHVEPVEHADSQREVEKYNYFTTPDLSGRVTPGVFRQYRYYIGRVAKQRLRDARVQAADYIILLLAGACLGTMAEVSDVSFGYSGYQYTVIAVSLLCMIGALRTFSSDKLQYRRESASGMNSLSYFLAKDTMDLLNVVMKPLVYLCMFYFFSYPRSSFESNYLVLLCLVYCVTGISYTLAISLEFSQAQLWSVLLPVVLTLIANQDKTSAVSLVSRFVFPRWALEAFVTANAKEYTGVWLMTRCAALKKFNFDIHNSKKCLCYLMATGFGCRVLAFICLMSRSK
ncbi:putative pleiotropic drug resistance protein PDR/CDR [Helianthus annuus]|uniref:Pleiotropic drug resistance protein PDR/CDR n=2 Tax=Helianthus annuus TaxID=4232 RepID=A0A9K3EHF0_HELAN|nr:putative white-brown complex homolog protein 30 isoform X1 [Helianthus annuus]KAF5773093.1 putative pleiotropic drug resistance protein PDR/CDR [Helianthus annuus]KAJ0480904.1 putative ABC transporter, AAA+ ATPase domain, P-loop containing nucleoside triphosphate hydrolase [Helianthus annuus]KAJ0497453.1 putative ABC transporter, AAA+ ATPase domain, P-loop containing nucleoside triphosphate hydrolase [Helianthus annuus]